MEAKNSDHATRLRVRNWFFSSLLDQSWGRIQVSGATASIRSQSLGNPFAVQLNDYDITKQGYLRLLHDVLQAAEN